MRPASYCKMREASIELMVPSSFTSAPSWQGNESTRPAPYWRISAASMLLAVELQSTSPIATGVAEGVGVAVGLGVDVCVGVCVGVALWVGVAVSVAVRLAVGVDVGVTVALSVGVEARVGSGVSVGVGVGFTSLQLALLQWSTCRSPLVAL
jgi:hypothetical protein